MTFILASLLATLGCTTSGASSERLSQPNSSAERPTSQLDASGGDPVVVPSQPDSSADIPTDGVGALPDAGSEPVEFRGVYTLAFESEQFTQCAGKGFLVVRREGQAQEAYQAFSATHPEWSQCIDDFHVTREGACHLYFEGRGRSGEPGELFEAPPWAARVPQAILTELDVIEKTEASSCR